MNMTDLTCAWCGVLFQLCTKELTRQTKAGRQQFFCSRSCGALHIGKTRLDRVQAVEKTCPVCVVPFQSTTGKRGKRFCSRSCASKGSVTENRRNRARETSQRTFVPATIETLANNMRTREAWKYAELKEALTNAGEYFLFECVVGSGVRDLVFPERKLIVEFDGPEHASPRQLSADRSRDAEALSAGWSVVRLPVPRQCVIPADILRNHILTHPKL